MVPSRVHLEERRTRQGIEECASVCVSLALALLFRPTGNTRGAVNVTGSTNIFFTINLRLFGKIASPLPSTVCPF